MKKVAWVWACLLLAGPAIAGCMGQRELPMPECDATTTLSDGSVLANPCDEIAPTVSFRVVQDGVEVPPSNGTVSVRTAEPITFDASATSDVDRRRLTFLWDFGDGATASGPRVIHEYEAGTHRLLLRVDAGTAVGWGALTVVATAPP